MSEALPKPVASRRDERFPVMPAHKDMLPQPKDPRPSARERNRPVNGPSIDEWEAALVGRLRIKEEAAYTRGSEEEKSLSVKGVRGVLLFCVKNAEGALSRIPVEVVEMIEQILHDTVCPPHLSSRVSAPYPWAHPSNR